MQETAVTTSILSMVGSWLTISVLTVILLTHFFGALVKGEHQDMICPDTELPTLGYNQTCLLSSLFNNSTNSSSDFETKINITDEPSTGNQVRLIDTGYASRETYESVAGVVNLILTPITTTLGLVGNTLSLVTLLYQKPRDTITIYLISLCVSDLLAMMCSIIKTISLIITRYNVALGLKTELFSFLWVSLFASIVGSRTSAFITVVLSLERMIAVKLPLVVKETFLNRHPWKIALVIWMCMILFSVPNFYRFDLSIRTNPVTNQSFVSIAPSQFSKSSGFYIYYGTAGQILTRILPMVIVLVCNLVIVITLRASARYRKRMISTGVEDHKTTRLLLTISGIFLFCTMPGAVNGIVIKFVDSYGFLKQEHYLLYVINLFCEFLDTVNSAINFVVYILLGSHFRAAFFKIWGRKCRQTKQKDESNIKTTKTNKTIVK